MMYNTVDDINLTEQQKTLKWSLYCESEHESDKNIVIVLESLLKDFTVKSKTNKLIDQILCSEPDGCIQIEETFDVDSIEGATTAIFLNGIYQNRAIAASAKLGIVDRYKLKDSSKDYQSQINIDDLEKDTKDERYVIERVEGDVQILCCSKPVLKLIQTIIGYNS